METRIAVETLLEWSAPKEVQTKFGPRLLRKAAPTEAFWIAWRNEQSQLKEQGISLGKTQAGVWEVCFWGKLDNAEQERRQESAELSRAAASDFEPPCPEGLRFYPFQKAGIAFLCQHFRLALSNTHNQTKNHTNRLARGQSGVLIADEPGLGKTIQAIGFINCDPEIRRVLVVTKASLKENWKREMRKWLVRPMELGIATGQHWPSHANGVIINYDVLGKHLKKLHAQTWDLVILDESAAIKNREAKRTVAIVGRRASPKRGLEAIPPLPATRRVCLSGTPIENRPEELWTTLYFLDPGTWGSFWSYARRYCGMVNNGYGVDTSGASNLEELQRRLRETVMIRRRKSEVLTELPPKTRVVVEIEAEDIADIVAEERRILAKYNEDLEAAQAKLELARASESDAEFKAAVKALASSTVAFDQMARVRHNTAVAKVPSVIEALREDVEEVGNKILVFAHHKDVIEPLARAFPRSLTITGETPAEDRQGICDIFQRDLQAGPFFGSIRACGEGLTLTAARLVVFAEEDWVPGKVSQAEDRAHRIGQKDNVLVKHYVLPGTIDAHMIQTIIEKQEVIDKALDADPGEWASEPVFVPRHEPLGKRKDIQEEALLITAEQMAAIRAALSTLAGLCDGAHQVDGQGFNKIDARIGKELAWAPMLTPRQAALGRRICRKYVRQLGAELVKGMG